MSRLYKGITLAALIVAILALILAASNGGVTQGASSAEKAAFKKAVSAQVQPSRVTQPIVRQVTFKNGSKVCVGTYVDEVAGGTSMIDNSISCN